MRYPKWYGLWTDPAGLPDGGAEGGALILIAHCRGEAVVVSARCPSLPRIPLGGDAMEALGIHPDLWREMTAEEGDTRPLFLRTRMGVGLLDRTYAAETGLYLYAHIHGRPRHLAALINGGALGNPAESGYLVSSEILADRTGVKLLREREYGVLADALEAAQVRRRGILRPSPDGAILWEQTEEAIRRLADMAGCEAVVQGAVAGKPSAAPVPRLMCYRPALWEILLLAAFCEAYRYGGGSATVELFGVTGREGDTVSVALSYAVENERLYRTEEMGRERARELLRAAAHAGGMELSAEATQGTVCVTLECLYDPAVLESSDLKVPDGKLEE